MEQVPIKERALFSWIPPPVGFFKFHDEASRGQPRPGSLGVVLRDSEGKVLFLFSKMCCYKRLQQSKDVGHFRSSSHFCRGFPRESDSSNVISWINSLVEGPWKFHFYFQEILGLFFGSNFRHGEGHSANDFANSLAKC